MRYHKQKSFIAKLQHDNGIATLQEEKEVVVWQYFNNLLGTAEVRSKTLNLAAFHHKHFNLQQLDKPISEQEVWEVIKTLPPDKTPRPDRFTGRFYHAFWSIIKQDVMAAIGVVHAGDFRKLYRLNSAYMVLIRKREDPTVVAD